MFDLEQSLDTSITHPVIAPAPRKASPFFWTCKRAFDIGMSLLLFPIFAIAFLSLLIFNPLFNRGSLFFIQDRMGQNCSMFRLVKFRSMHPIDKITRGPNDPLETDRITAMGRFLRKTRIDELPQILNVLRGDMSLIGPRPDYYEHAKTHIESIPGYCARHAVRPGISGLAQTKLGYSVSEDETTRKVQVDLEYIAKVSFRMEAKLVWETIKTVVTRAGA